MQAWLRYSLLATVTVSSVAHWQPGTDATPAYYSVIPHRALAPILSPSQRTGADFSHPFQVTAYGMAAAIDKVLYAQPCFCRCDRAMRHKSLHSCFEGTHAAVCATCMREGIYAYQQTKLGRTPDQIRVGIMNGEAKDIRLEDAAL